MPGPEGLEIESLWRYGKERPAAAATAPRAIGRAPTSKQRGLSRDVVWRRPVLDGRWAQPVKRNARLRPSSDTMMRRVDGDSSGLLRPGVGDSGRHCRVKVLMGSDPFRSEGV